MSENKENTVPTNARSRSHSRSKAKSDKDWQPELENSKAKMNESRKSSTVSSSSKKKLIRRNGDQTYVPRLLNGADRIGPESFEKLKILGSGDVGKVFMVTLKGTNQVYAMKTMPKEEMVKRNKVRRVMTEREILSTANHPFIVTLYNSFQSKDKLYFIMDYCAGGEFFRVLQKQPHRLLQENAGRFYAAEVLLALEYLHMLGYVYRDLKPENILMHESGHIMLTDFDLSKAAATTTTPKVVKGMFNFGRRPSAPGLNVEPEVFTNSFVGTEEYIAPEVISGLGHTQAVDWWTLGILIYEMLFSTTPYRGKSRDETFDNIMAGGLKFPDYPMVSSSCRSLIKKLLHPDPKKRLGAEHGAIDIKNHPWFKSINWALLRNETPPIVPKRLDLSSIRKSNDDDKDLHRNSHEAIAEEEDEENPFHGFAFERLEDAFYSPSVRKRDARDPPLSSEKKK